jgi:HAD superfamily hydrolase (TIGR01509 family)
VQGIIFDLDGVLVNSMPSHSRSWVDAFWNIAKVRIERRTLYVLEGMRGIELTEKILEEHDSDLSLAKKVIAEKDRLFKEMERPKAFEGVKEMIESLACSKAVVSGSSRHDVESILDKVIGKEKFDAIVTADDVKRGKPDPLAFETALFRLHVSANDAVVVENAPLGVRAANNAGIPCYVVLNNTLLSRTDFEGIIAKDRMFEKTGSLKGLLQEMCRRQ